MRDGSPSSNGVKISAACVIMTDKFNAVFIRDTKSFVCDQWLTAFICLKLFFYMTQIVRFRVYLPETLTIFPEDTRHNEWQQWPYKWVLSFRGIPLTVNWLPNFPLPFSPVALFSVAHFFLSGCPNFRCPFSIAHFTIYRSHSSVTDDLVTDKLSIFSFFSL